jgi:hypothetical protein
MGPLLTQLHVTQDLYVVYFMAVTEPLHDGYEENHENIQTR